MPIHALAPMLLAAVVTAQDGCQREMRTPAWDALRQKHRGLSTESDIERLWTLRIQLCVDAVEGRITGDEASERFERERQRLIEEWGGAENSAG